MGNKFGRRKQVVEEKYTKPQGLYEIKDVDYKKLRKLILDSKLAPCYPGGDDHLDHDFDSFTSLPLEECPICFLYYPTLNRSRCCMKSICTECFLQIKNPSSTRPTQCPFCKTFNYAVEYRGVKSKEEKGMEQIEEQKVIEAKIRMQREQCQEEEERQQRKEERSSISGSSMTHNPCYGVSGVIEHMDVTPSQDSSSMQMLRQAQNTGQYRDEEFDVDLEDIMVMEAIWLSIQENGRAGQSSSTNAVVDPTTSGDCHVSQAEVLAAASSSTSSSPPSGGIACSAAALSERRHFSGELSSTYSRHVSLLETLPSSSGSSKRVKKNQHNRTNISDDFKHKDILLPQPSYGRRYSKRVKNIQRICSINKAEEWDRIAEAGITYGSSDDSDMDIEAIALPPPPPPPLSTRDESDGEDFFGLMLPTPPPYSGDGGFQNGLISTPVIPEGFDEQMMLAMALSIAEA